MKSQQCDSLNKTHTVPIPVDVPNIYRGNLTRPTLGEELQAINGCQERKNKFYLAMSLLVGYSVPRGQF